MSKPITCGDDCGACEAFNDEWLLVVPVGDGPRQSIGGQHRPVLATQLAVNFCPRCGRPLGFTEEGVPTVGPSYAELERQAAWLAGKISHEGECAMVDLSTCVGGDDEEECVACWLKYAERQIGGTSEQEAGG